MKRRMIRAVYFVVVWLCIGAAEVKQSDDLSENTDIDFSFLEENPQHETWVDPFNMFEFKSFESNSKSDDKKDSADINRAGTTIDGKIVGEQITAKKANYDAVSSQDISDVDKNGADSCKDEEFIYLKRTANMILNKIKTLKQHSPSNDLHVKLTVTDEVVNTLNIFLRSPCRHIQDFDTVISELLNYAQLTESHSYLATVYRYFNRHFEKETVVYCVTIFIAIIISWGQLRFSIWKILSHLIIFTFILSFVWNWVLLMKIEIANAHAKTEKIKSGCDENKLGLYEKIYVIFNNIFYSTDSCKEYYEAVLVEPIWKVSPLVVLSKTLSDLFFHPLGYFGHHLGLFFQNLFRQVPWYLLLPVSFMVTLFILLLLLMLFKYRIKLPFWLGAIEPGQQPPHSGEHNQLISDMLEGRVHIQRCGSVQDTNTTVQCSNCTENNCASVTTAADCTQKAVLQNDEQEMMNAKSADEGTQTSIAELSSLSCLCYDTLVNSTVVGKIQNLEKVMSNSNCPCSKKSEALTDTSVTDNICIESS